MPKALRTTVKSEINNYTTRSCPTCGQVFFARGSLWTRIRFCCTQCCRIARNQRQRERRKKRADAHRHQKRGTCVRCGLTLYFQVRATRRYCSDRCRQQAYRQRQKTMALSTERDSFSAPTK
jgi:endogenous inhibitor of DNA gyrase (YacG/DUF329 family)